MVAPSTQLEELLDGCSYAATFVPALVAQVGPTVRLSNVVALFYDGEQRFGEDQAFPDFAKPG